MGVSASQANLMPGPGFYDSKEGFYVDKKAGP